MLKKEEKSKFVNFFWILFYFLVFLIVVRGGFSYLDPDFGWHLKVGEAISMSGQVPHANLYNYTYSGNWVDHEWLSNLGLYYLYNFAGYEALVIFFALIIIGVLILLNIFVSRRSGYKIPIWLSASLQLLGVLAALPHFGVRLQELALPFVLLVLIILDNYERRRRWTLLLFLASLFWLWASLHASFLIGLFLVAAFVAIKIGERLIYQRKFWSFIDSSKLMAWRGIGFLGLGFSISLIATFFTPYKLGLYEFLAGYKNNAYLSLIQEWLPQYSFPFHYYQLVYLAIGAAAILFYIYYRLKAKRGLEIWPLFLTVLFLALSFKSRRHFPLFLIATLPFIVETYSYFFTEIKIAYYKWLRYLVFFCLALVILSQLMNIRPVPQPFAGFCDDYPCAAVKFLRTNPEYLAGNVFNEYGWGGFLIAELPEIKIFIDGRLPQVALADWTFVEEYNSFFHGDESPQIKLDKYNIDTILIKAEDKPVVVKKWEKFFFVIRDEDLVTKNKLREYLEQEIAWKLIYNDGVAKIYLRRK
ncbi:MAG: hypothetical protein HY931_03685 [Candidatus Falkowbacteria bacterium]|nr:MAG: hypothetical protein HY931_03685 [Candidatus Falkowbacteria bacterium]